MVMNTTPRSPGRRFWETHTTTRLGGFIAVVMLAISIWFLHGRIRLLEEPHSPHYSADHCYDCHEGMEGKDGAIGSAIQCYTCHDMLSRALLPNAKDDLKRLAPNGDCLHDLKTEATAEGKHPVTALCISCHKTVRGYVAMVDITANRYVEVDISATHPIGLMPTATIYPRTLPLSKETGAINCITCHDQHAMDRRLRMLRYYYPGNGRPADFRPLCLDCHTEGWLPLKRLHPDAIREAKPHKEGAL